jgi:hypothetical protein
MAKRRALTAVVSRILDRYYKGHHDLGCICIAQAANVSPTDSPGALSSHPGSTESS